MPVYAKGPKKWRVRIWWRGERRDWLVEGAKSDAELFEAKKRLELQKGETRIELRVVPKFSSFCVTDYQAHAEIHLKKRTWSNRQYQIATLVEHLGDYRLHEIGTREVEAFKEARTEEGISPTTVNDELKTLITILNYARSLGHALPQPRFRRLPVRGRRRNAEAWTHEEAGWLCQAMADYAPLLLPVVVFLLNTGARKGEAIALEWENVDLKRGLVRIWASEEWQPKDEDNREVPIGDELAPWLPADESKRKSKRWAFPARAGNKKKGTASWTNYKFWPQNMWDRALRKWNEKHPDKRLTGGPHKTRHTFASHFLEKCPDLYLLGKIMGHSDTKITALYSHLLPSYLERARNAVRFKSPVGPAALEAISRWRDKSEKKERTA